MRRTVALATVISAVLLLGVAAAGAQPGDTVRGQFEPLENTDLDISGHATLTRTGEDRTHLSVQVKGLEGGEHYMSHLHAGSCEDLGPHYQDDADGEDAPPNELWPSSDPHDPEAGLHANPAGNAQGRGTADWRARDEAGSVFIHGHGPDGPHTKIACADLS